MSKPTVEGLEPRLDQAESQRDFVERCHRDPEMLRAYPKGHDRRHAAQKIWAEAQPQARYLEAAEETDPSDPSPPHPVTPSASEDD